MGDILFSYVVAAYNIEKYIQECIDSILEQTHCDFELIIVDDGSNDKTGKICDEYAQKDKRVKVIHQVNKGLVRARKVGIEYAKGEYIIFIDGDDWIDKDMGEEIARYIEKYNPDIFISEVVKEYATYSSRIKNYVKKGYYDKQKIREDIYPIMIYTGKFFEKGLASYITGKAIKRDILLAVKDSVDDRGSWGEGTIFLYSCMLKVNSVVITEDVFYHYRMREDSISLQDMDDSKLVIIYENLLKNIIANNYNIEQFVLQLDYLAMFLFIWKKFDVFDNDNEKFFLFPMVKKESKIVLYGAWRFGQDFKAYIERKERANIVLWVDKNAEEYRKYGWNVDKPEKILDTEYNYIILATAMNSVAHSMRRALEEMGITENILSIDNNVINLEDLPHQINAIKEKYQLTTN